MALLQALPIAKRRPNTTYSLTAQGRITLLNLPIEIVMNIISWLPRSEVKLRRGHSKLNQHPYTHCLKVLRLTCKSLAALILPLLINAVNLYSYCSAGEFLTWCKKTAAEGHHIPVRRLTIRNVGRPSSDNNSQSVPYDVFEDIVMALAPHLYQLKVAFKECFEFSEKLALAFRSAKQLWVLHLSMISEPPTDSVSPSTMSSELGRFQLHNPIPFFRSLMSLTNLIELDLNNCFDFCTPIDPNYQFTSLPRVRHLSASFDRQSTSSPSEPYKSLSLLCRAMADSILIFEVKGSRYDPSMILPILATIRGNLEALRLSDITLVKECAELQFPRLRTLEIDDSRYLEIQEFNLPIFNQVTTLLLRKWSWTDATLDIPVENMRKLRRVVLTYTPCFTPDTVPLQSSCRAGSVDLLASAKSVDLREIWAIDAMEAYKERHSNVPAQNP